MPIFVMPITSHATVFHYVYVAPVVSLPISRLCEGVFANVEGNQKHHDDHLQYRQQIRHQDCAASCVGSSPAWTIDRRLVRKTYDENVLLSHIEAVANPSEPDPASFR
jgi:hypothetical protein